ncbi:3-methyl-2-oxobutanoate hydroxymethyltransferase [Pelagibacteraceae bacterium]|nr:3-methyl-2-oxobutanoate hydroxymethyltransferase [Pelagibacteraceae bacterium]
MKKKKIILLNKKFKKPITCLTAYSASIGKLLDGNVDLVLVGDSLGTTLYGMRNLQKVTLDMMISHGVSVIKNVKKSISVIDMPYKTYNNKSEALKNAKKILNFTKAQMLKIEIKSNKLHILKYLADNNLNIIAHIGVTPQSFTNFHKIKAVGKKIHDSHKLIKLAKNAETAGAKAILLECVTQQTSKKITSELSIPTIGIGSSKYCDGQILVFDDLINIDNKIILPRFVKNYMNFSKLAKEAIKSFNKEVKNKKFPTKKYSYQ